MNYITLILTAAVLIISTVTDLRNRKIYNWITFPAMIIGLLTAGFPLHATAYVRLAWMTGCFFFGMLGIIGLGDLKLIMAVIALRGYMEAIWMVACGAIVMLLYLLIRERKLMMQTLQGYFRSVVYKTDMIPRTGKAYPFAPFLAVGYCIAFAIMYI